MATTINEIDRAFLMMSRQDFLPLSSRYVNVFDAPLSIGYGQTCSQPSTVRMMLKWLDVKPGNKVLDIGSGSGWTTALLSVLVGERGSVFAVERIPKLVEFGAENCRRAGVKNARFFYAKESVVGLPEHSPFDNILVSASGKKVSRKSTIATSQLTSTQ